MSKFEELESKVGEWAEGKGLIFEGNQIAQIEKFLEEADELADEVHLESKEGILMEGGDVLVTLCIQAKLNGLTLTDMLEAAYNKISKRKGKTINGQFVKEDK